MLQTALYQNSWWWSNKKLEFSEGALNEAHISDIRAKGAAQNFSMRPNKKHHGLIKRAYKLQTNGKDIANHVHLTTLHINWLIDNPCYLITQAWPHNVHLCSPLQPHQPFRWWMTQGHTFGERAWDREPGWLVFWQTYSPWCSSVCNNLCTAWKWQYV